MEATETGRFSLVLKAPLSPDAFIAGEMLHSHEGLTRATLRAQMAALKALVQRGGQ